LTRLPLAALLALLPGCSRPAPAPDAPPRAPRIHNPLFDGADPHAMIFGDACWVYPTGASPGRENFFA